MPIAAVSKRPRSAMQCTFSYANFCKNSFENRGKTEKFFGYRYSVTTSGLTGTNYRMSGKIFRAYAFIETRFLVRYSWQLNLILF
jgi:hypothetical protein